jgi:hypothetical protein
MLEMKILLYLILFAFLQFQLVSSQSCSNTNEFVISTNSSTNLLFKVNQQGNVIASGSIVANNARSSSIPICNETIRGSQWFLYDDYEEDVVVYCSKRWNGLWQWCSPSTNSYLECAAKWKFPYSSYQLIGGRQYFGTTSISDSIFVAGGFNGSTISNFEQFNFTTNKWTTLTSSSTNVC